MRKKQSAPVALRYVGAGAYIPFVPARDLTAEEAEQHWQTIQAAEASGQRLYVPAENAGEKKER